MGENNKTVTFSLRKLSNRKRSNRLIIREKNAPPEFAVIDYMKLFIPPRWKKSRLWGAFQNFQKQMWLIKR